jgi:hypothetical protein
MMLAIFSFIIWLLWMASSSLDVYRAFASALVVELMEPLQLLLLGCPSFDMVGIPAVLVLTKRFAAKVGRKAILVGPAPL